MFKKKEIILVVFKIELILNKGTFNKILISFTQSPLDSRQLEA